MIVILLRLQIQFLDPLISLLNFSCFSSYKSFMFTCFPKSSSLLVLILPTNFPTYLVRFAFHNFEMAQKRQYFATNLFCHIFSPSFIFKKRKPCSLFHELGESYFVSLILFYYDCWTFLELSYNYLRAQLNY